MAKVRAAAISLETKAPTHLAASAEASEIEAKISILISRGWENYRQHA